jgi:hypothetical protein
MTLRNNLSLIHAVADGLKSLDRDISDGLRYLESNCLIDANDGATQGQC